MTELELQLLNAKRDKHDLAMALFVCAGIAGWSIGGWQGFLVFLLFAAIAGNA
jgi:hypothetical protein